MKRIRVYGCSEDLNLKEEIKKASSLFINYLIPRKRKYDITISLSPKLLIKSGSHGECWSWSRNTYCIKLDKTQTKEAILKTLAHECVHVKQFASGELKFLNKFDIWQGKVYYHGAKYELLPWEREANKYETILYDKYTLS